MDRHINYTRLIQFPRQHVCQLEFFLFITGNRHDLIKLEDKRKVRNCTFPVIAMRQRERISRLWEHRKR